MPVASSFSARGRAVHLHCVEGSLTAAFVGSISIDFWSYIGVFMPAESGRGHTAVSRASPARRAADHCDPVLGVSIANESKSSDQRAFGGCLGGKRR